jgi:glycosyltransferase involved in cell wall biosynthesis
LLVSHLDRERFSPTVLSLKHGGEWAEGIRASGVPVIELRRRRRFELSRLWGLWRAIRGVRPDLVITWMYPANIWGRLVALAAGVPHLIACARTGAFYSSLHRWLEKRLAPYTDFVVFNSRYNEERMGKALRRARTRTIYNVLELPPVDPAQGRHFLSSLGVAPRAALVGMVASLLPLKDYDLFLEAASRLASRPDVHFLIVGRGSERERLEREVERLGLAGRVTFTGFVEERLPLIASLRVKVLTSAIEGMANVLMEAMALGVPCVVSAAGANPELITDGIEGFVIRERDPGAYADRISALLDSPERWEAASRAARRRMHSGEFSVDRIVRAYEDLFAEALAGGASRRRVSS